MRPPPLVGALVTALAAGLIAACGGPGRRDGSGANPAGPSQNAQPVVVGVEISGPASIPPGQAARFTAIARLSDGTSHTVTSVQWSSRTGLLQVDASGLATARQQTGEDILSVQVTSGGSAGVIRASREILVLPDGTYRMVGVVTERGLEAGPVVGARVEVTSGTPVVAISDWEGRYRLYGVPGTADIRVTRYGYHTHVQSFQLADHATQDFQLVLSGMRLDLAGQYTLAIDVDCGTTSTPVPADMRHLTYAASVAQSGATLQVALTEPRFRVNDAGHGDRFGGRVDATTATFNLDDFSSESFWYFGPPYDPSTYANVVERLLDGTFLVVSGMAVTSGTPAGLSGELRGSVQHHDSRFPSVPLLTSVRGICYSTAHRFRLTRR